MKVVFPRKFSDSSSISPDPFNRKNSFSWKTAGYLLRGIDGGNARMFDMVAENLIYVSIDYQVHVTFTCGINI